MSSVSFTVKPPPPSGSGYRPSGMGNGSRHGAPSRRLFEEGGDDDDDEDGRTPRSRRVRDERIDGMSNGRSTGGEKAAGPLVIPALPNRDWRQSSRRSVPQYRPESAQRTEDDLATHERTGDGPQRSGLRRIVKEEVSTGDPEVKQEPAEPLNGQTNSISVKTEPDIKEEPLSLEEQALRAVLAGNSTHESQEDRIQRELVIGMQANTYDMSEADAYKRDIVNLPEESTLDDYANIPVEAFGLAMARGMGWDPKSSQNTVLHEPKVRPQLLGLGATPMDATIKPTHAKHGANKRDRQAERNARTGRGFVATSLLVKKEREGSISTSATASRAVSPGAGDSDGSRRRRRDDDYDSGREVKRERSDRDGADRDRDGRRYETEEERARRKARERERDHETEEERAKRKAREREREYETEEERARRKAREREREYETEEERARRKARERERERDRDSERRYDERERARDRRR